MITYRRGNIFDADVDVLVNTVNSVGVMGKGVALNFKKRFPENYKAYRKAVEDGLVHPGSVFVYQMEEDSRVKYIANFATKNHWRHPSQYEWIEKGLKGLKEKLSSLKVDSIAMPALGSGLGGLDWVRVKKLIENELNELPVRVVCYEPLSETKVGLNKDSKPKAKKLTIPRAALLHLFYQYELLGGEITELVAEKFCYFLQKVGFEKMNLNFQKGFYGPYSGKVKLVLREFDGYYIKGYELAAGKPFAKIELLTQRKKEVELFIEENFTEKEKDLLKRTERLIERCGNTSGLELLATVDFLISQKKRTPTVEAIIESIREWSPRKGWMFNKEQVETAMEVLSKTL